MACSHYCRVAVPTGCSKRGCLCDCVMSYKAAVVRELCKTVFFFFFFKRRWHLSAFVGGGVGLAWGVELALYLTGKPFISCQVNQLGVDVIRLTGNVMYEVCYILKRL